jgi:hypothetical protein
MPHHFEIEPHLLQSQANPAACQFRLGYSPSTLCGRYGVLVVNNQDEQFCGFIRSLGVLTQFLFK